MSSLKDLASLIMIPSLVKDGRLDTVKPLGNEIIHPDATGNNDGTDGSTPSEGNFTFSRGSNLAATRVDVNGLIEKGRENVIVYSQDFSNANWSTNQSATISHGITDPNGGSTASRLTFAANVNSGIYQQNPTLFASGNIRTASLYMKGSVGGEVVMFGDATNRTSVTLTTSWVRYEGFALDASTYFIIYTDTSSPSADTIDIAFAQYENGLVATDYIETGASTAQAGILEDLPRLDYSGGASCPALLLEPQRSNLITQSEYFGGWTNDTNTSLTPNAIQSPSGFVDAYKMSAGTSNARQGRTLNVSVSGSLALSVYAKKGEYSVVQLTDAVNASLYANFDLENGVLGNYNRCTPSIEDAGNGWYRCIITWTASVNINKVRVSIAESKTQGRLVDFVGNGTDGLYIFGAQLEAGSYPTSYIPTYGSAVTRNKENSYKSSISDLIGQEQGTLFAEVDISHLDGTTARDLFFLSNTDNVSDDWIGIGFSGVGSNTLRGRIVDSGSLKFDQYGTIPSTGRYKIALAYENGNGAFYVNGVSFGTNYVNTNFSLTLDRVFNAPVGFSSQFADDVKQLLIFPTRLTNAELAALTTI